MTYFNDLLLPITNKHLNIGHFNFVLYNFGFNFRKHTIKYCLINERVCFIDKTRLASSLNVFKNDVQCRSNHSIYLQQISTCIVLLIVLKF